MSDPTDYFTSYDDLEEDILAEHHPDVVLEDLNEEFEAKPLIWEVEQGFGQLEMACGCVVDVRPGDTVWYITGRAAATLMPVAIEPVTIH